MPDFNFYSWQENSELKNKIYSGKALLIFVTVSALIYLLTHFMLSRREIHVHKKVEVLQAEFNNLKMTTLKDNHSAELPLKTGKLLTELSNVKNKNMCFTKISRTDQKFLFEGKSKSVNAFTRFFSLWPVGSYFSDIRIRRMNQDKTGILHFTFEARRAEE